MHRRTFLRNSAGFLAAAGSTGCGMLDIFSPKPDPVPGTTVRINTDLLAQAVQTQRCEQWCWAASISMIFAYHGHTVSQEEIVAQTYGAVVCLPAYTTYTIGSDLSRPYRDSQGRVFTSQVSRAYDSQNGIFSLTNQQIVAELKANRPLLYCNTRHAEVLYSVTYLGTAAAPNIIAASVVDPWPFSQRTHELSPTEIVADVNGGEMKFLAAVNVS